MLTLLVEQGDVIESVIFWLCVLSGVAVGLRIRKRRLVQACSLARAELDKAAFVKGELVDGEIAQVIGTLTCEGKQPKRLEDGQSVAVVHVRNVRFSHNDALIEGKSRADHLTLLRGNERIPLVGDIEIGHGARVARPIRALKSQKLTFRQRVLHLAPQELGNKRIEAHSVNDGDRVHVLGVAKAIAGEATTAGYRNSATTWELHADVGEDGTPEPLTLTTAGTATLSRPSPVWTAVIGGLVSAAIYFMIWTPVGAYAIDQLDDGERHPVAEMIALASPLYRDRALDQMTSTASGQNDFELATRTARRPSALRELAKNRLAHAQFDEASALFLRARQGSTTSSNVRGFSIFSDEFAAHMYSGHYRAAQELFAEEVSINRCLDLSLRVKAGEREALPRLQANTVESNLSCHVLAAAETANTHERLTLLRRCPDCARPTRLGVAYQLQRARAVLEEECSTSACSRELRPLNTLLEQPPFAADSMPLRSLLLGRINAIISPNDVLRILELLQQSGSSETDAVEAEIELSRRMAFFENATGAPDEALARLQHALETLSRHRATLVSADEGEAENRRTHARRRQQLLAQIAVVALRCHALDDAREALAGIPESQPLHSEIAAWIELLGSSTPMPIERASQILSATNVLRWHGFTANAGLRAALLETLHSGTPSDDLLRFELTPLELLIVAPRLTPSDQLTGGLRRAVVRNDWYWPLPADGPELTLGRLSGRLISAQALGERSRAAEILLVLQRWRTALSDEDISALWQSVYALQGLEDRSFR